MLSKKTWGNATWYLIHTLAYKLNDESHISDLVLQIYQICDNLPCIECRDHAILLLLKNNYKNINSKQQLILFLLDFHNAINYKLNKPKFTIEENNKMYSRGNTINIINNFFEMMKYQNYNEKALLHSYRRKRFIINFKIYIYNNRSKYD
tara:strand:+ start:376 stop:825 length:450 start_codon:yes stop_codon:yes gene_type:complete